MDIQLARQELEEIAKYTLQKIKNYPVECSKNIDDYFELLFEDEVMNYLVRREMNEKSSQFLLAADCE